MTAAVPTTASEPSNETAHYDDVADDHTVRVASAEYVDRIAVFILESDLPRTVTVTTLTSSISAGIAAGSLVRRPIPSERATIRIDSSESRMTLVTSYSTENGQYIETQFDDDSSTLIAGPSIGTDVRGAAIGDTLGTSFDVPLIVARRRFGLHRNMERTA